MSDDDPMFPGSGIRCEFAERARSAALPFAARVVPPLLRGRALSGCPTAVLVLESIEKQDV